MSVSKRLFVAWIGLGLTLGPGLASIAQAQSSGVLGIYFDDRASKCSDTFSVGQSRTIWVMFLPEGDTRGGITISEFRVVANGASGYSFSAPTLLSGSILLGSVFEGGVMAASPNCESRQPLPVLKFTVLNLGGGRDATLEIAERIPPSNRDFPCPLVTLCDNPIFTKICITPDRAVLNPSGSLRCGIASEQSDWGRVKELYR
jgi:hypothetical protein